MEITSYFQSAVSFLTPATIRRGVSLGPEGNFRGSAWPVASIFTLVPPMSITSTFTPDSSPNQLPIAPVTIC